MDFINELIAKEDWGTLGILAYGGSVAIAAMLFKKQQEDRSWGEAIKMAIFWPIKMLKGK